MNGFNYVEEYDTDEEAESRFFELTGWSGYYQIRRVGNKVEMVLSHDEPEGPPAERSVVESHEH